MDLFGSKARQERDEERARAERAEAEAKTAKKKLAQAKQDNAELIQQLRFEIAQLRNSGAPAAEVSAKQRRLDEAMSVHGRATR